MLIRFVLRTHILQRAIELAEKDDFSEVRFISMYIIGKKPPPLTIMLCLKHVCTYLGK